MSNRIAISSYLRIHPNATVREIQKECGVSSTSVVHYHLQRLKWGKKKTVCCPMCYGVGRVPENEIQD
jgi:hypothetical protein